MYVVLGAFHWIGYQIITRLLDDSYEVIGIDKMESEKKENLSMYIGRNSLFTHVSSSEEMNQLQKLQQINILFEIDSSQLFNDRYSLNTETVINLDKGRVKASSNTVDVDLPLLYGEWMPRNDNGVYHNGQFVAFDSEQFKNEAVYIQDFITCLIETISNYKQDRVAIKAFDPSFDSKDAQKTICIRETKDKDERIKELNDHYKMYKNFY
ncbi:hypothetical protein [Aquibacillus albus]|uniref:Nucleoside-diphosphate-sugar epimerase n=1 Tax=Aquibacillus albus TaxID=1168171 RepID=A0ABS2N056_9BACI|nr:hypothetical protein [Aquibacillus albus]MBM7571522.1 nucleoside-diphosphate-sugar epimerase [Aquibacillus albus]